MIKHNNNNNVTITHSNNGYNNFGTITINNGYCIKVIMPRSNILTRYVHMIVWKCMTIKQ